MSELVLGVEGAKYSGWQRIRVTRSMEAIAGSFALSVSDRWGTPVQPWPIAAEDECTIAIDDQPVLSGWIDGPSMSLDAEAHELSYEGRSTCGMLVDCSVDVRKLGASEFSKIGIREICQKVCSQFDILVYLQDGLSDAAISTAPSTKTKTKAGQTSSVGSAGKTSAAKIGRPVDKFSIHQGESAFSVIDRACRLAGVMPVDDGSGGLVLTRAGGSVVCSTAIVQGQNLLRGRVRYDAGKRYYRCIVVGQTPSTDEQNGLDAASVRSLEAIDQGVRRKQRTLIVAADEPVTQDFASARARWQLSVINARASQFAATVQGWTQADGTIWPLNGLVRFTSPKLGVDDDLLITAVEFQRSVENGTTTEFTLSRPDAFLPEALITSKSAPGWGLGNSIIEKVNPL